MARPSKAFQDFYPDDVAHCDGCGRLNPEGHGLKSYWDGDETVAWYQPRLYHTAIPGYVYGGLTSTATGLAPPPPSPPGRHRRAGPREALTG